ncbi:MAG TPA: hypothetical protein VJN89_21775 [Candidatus Acidoferrum sp.]|nr:hypothetical protein [Candidatus Acidoferrum sp.]
MYALFQAALAVSQTQPATPHEIESKALEGALSLSQALTGWAILIVAGSVVILVGTDYRRPHQAWARKGYLAFIPAWCLLALSMYSGIAVHRAYVSYLVSRSPDYLQLRNAMNDYSYKQLWSMEAALGFFGIWLVFYLVWWVWFAGMDHKKEG